jgi:NAD(P)-dependent dehydrogenase (short-subunit alcohol dehydrogenase family)
MPIPDVSDRSLADLFSLKCRAAVVTGAAWGLGKAAARRLAEAGASVLIADIDEETAAASAAELQAAYGSRVVSMRMDAAETSAADAVLDRALAEFGSLDIVINNAGVPSFTPLLDLSAEDWDRVMAINVRGTFLFARESARRMIAAGKGGVIINVASLAGVRGISEGQAAYVASKHAVVGLTRQLSMELASHGIRVLGVAPGFCLTEKTAHLATLDGAALAQIPIPGIGGTKLGRVGVSDDVARAILFCASDMASFMTGSTLLVEGGIAA